MATAPNPVSLDEYLNTDYSPDCEYIDGAVVERNVGKRKHARTQAELAFRLRVLLEGRPLFPNVEQRVRVSATRIRIPDVCVLAHGDDEVIGTPPLLCVEVFSPDDRWNRVNGSVRDYQSMGVPCVWVIDPYLRQAWIFDRDQPPAQIGRDGVLRAEALNIELPFESVLPPKD
jgi:Uma2 family endonuclease